MTAPSLNNHLKSLPGKFPDKGVCLFLVFERGEMDHSPGFYPRCKHIEDRIHPIRSRDDRTVEQVNRKQRHIRSIPEQGIDPVLNTVQVYIPGKPSECFGILLNSSNTRSTSCCRNYQGSDTTKWYQYAFAGLNLVSDTSAFACKPGIVKNGPGIELVSKCIFTVDGNRIFPCKNLIACCAAAAGEPGNFVQHCFNIPATRDNSTGDILPVLKKNRRQGENCNISNHIEMVRKVAEFMVRDAPPQLLLQTHDFPERMKSVLPTMIRFPDPFLWINHILMNKNFFVLFIMTQVRAVERVLRAYPTVEGAGVRLHRAFGSYEVPQFDPFLMLDDFRAQRPEDYLAGFPTHPHRGIETVTYMLKGTVQHKDSMGNAGSINAGDVQWMTAGSGIVHSEMPKPVNGQMGGFQLWVNLPRSHKMMDPRYQEITHNRIPTVSLLKGVTVRVICGMTEGMKGPVRDIVADPEYLDVTMDPDAVFSHPVKEGYTAMAYVIGGEGTFDPAEEYPVNNHDLVLFGNGSSMGARSSGRGFRFLFFSGKPIHEPVAWRGPIVMNTTEELRQAFREYEEGTFIKKKTRAR